MFKFEEIFRQKRKLNLLCLGAHCDDIEIGCGGTILKLAGLADSVQIKWVVFCSTDVRKREAEQSADLFLTDVANKDIEIMNFRDGFLPSAWSSVKTEFERIKEKSLPDIVFTHFRHDLHQDHRTLNELTWNTFRNHFILEYEIPKYDGDIGNPNLFVTIDRDLLNKKIEILHKCFKSQLQKQWFDETLLTSLPRLRGMECASETNFAEAFYSRKLTL